MPMSMPRSNQNRCNLLTAPLRRKACSVGCLLVSVLVGTATGITTLHAKGGAPAFPPIGVVTPQITTSGITVPLPPFLATPSVAASTHGFTITGFIQDAAVSDGSPGAPASECRDLPANQQGGTAVVNGLSILIPCNTTLQMPAATFTWAEVLDKSTFPIPMSLAGIEAAGISGAANFRYPSNEITIVGNVVNGRYIAGLVYVSQEKLNLGQGFITGFDYATGAIIVDGRARLLLNDPPIGAPIQSGRFGLGQSPDGRFSVDNQNPTIKATTGYPMCVPRLDPAIADDPRCPKKNRPLAASGCRNFRAAGIILPTGAELAPPKGVYCSAFVMKAPPGTPTSASLRAGDIATSTEPDSREQAPFQIGDFINYSGTLLFGNRAGPGGSDTISVHTINANVGIFTHPGTLPAYLGIEDFGVSADAPLIFNGIPQEPQNRIFVVGNVTDVLSVVDIYLVDLDPVSGKESQRWITPASMTGGVGGIGSSGVYIDGGITTQRDGAQPGRVRLRATRANPGILVSPTRYLRLVARSLCDPVNINGNAPLVGAKTPTSVPCLRRAPASNGLFSGQYLAPNFNFIFPENLVVGDPIVPNNFWALGFLVNGEGPGTGGLIPTPW